MTLKLSILNGHFPSRPALRPVVRPSLESQYRHGTLPVRDGLDVVLHGVNREYQK